MGSLLSLYGVFKTLSNQAERDRKADERHLRDRKHDRIREAYRQVAAAAYHLPHHASVLLLTEVFARREGKATMFIETLQQQSPDTSEDWWIIDEDHAGRLGARERALLAREDRPL